MVGKSVFYFQPSDAQCHTPIAGIITADLGNGLMDLTVFYPTGAAPGAFQKVRFTDKPMPACCCFPPAEKPPKEDKKAPAKSGSK